MSKNKLNLPVVPSSNFIKHFSPIAITLKRPFHKKASISPHSDALNYIENLSFNYYPQLP